VRTAEPGVATRIVRAVRSDSLARNSMAIMGTSVVNAGLGYGYWTAAARLMPASEVGLGSAVISAMVIISLAVHLGPGAGLIARLPSRKPRQQWLLTMQATQLACSAGTLLVALVALVPIAVLVPPLRVLIHDPTMAGLFVIGAVGWTGSGLVDYTFIAQRQSGLMLARNAIASGFKLLALLALSVFGTGVGALGLVGTWATSGLVGWAVGLWFCHASVVRLGRIRFADVPAELRALVRPSLGHHAISMGGLLPTYLLPVVVTARLGTQDNAYFYITWMVGSAIFMISPAVASAVFAEGTHNPAQLRALSGRSLRIVSVLLVLAIVVIALAGNWVLGIFGPHYAAEGGPLLIVLLMSALPDAVTNIAVATFRVRKSLRAAAWLNGGMAAISVIGAWFLTTWFGIIGAGVAWLAAQTAGALVVGFARTAIWPASPTDGVPARRRTDASD
jgi:O-antigen/teichoic acid export membrane protein